MTRALGIRYLWIDSLCIIQDSNVDWAREGSQMDKIYKNARVTLAATSVSSCEEDFLRYLLKEDSAIVPLNPRLQPWDDQKWQSSVEIVIQCVDQWRVDLWEEDVDMSVWNSRGWTLQERYLSQRILHFCKTQVFWECPQEHKSECGQQILNLPIRGLPSFIMDGATDVEDPEPESVEPEHEENAEVQSRGGDDSTDGDSSQGESSVLSNRYIAQPMYDWWFQILCQYTASNLTYSSDKLPALSGLAIEMFQEIKQIVPHEEYLAGIWKGNLAPCLLWTLEYPPTTSNRPYRSPTWSWARWDSPAVPPTFENTRDGVFAPDDEEEVIEYVSHYIEYDGENIFGSIKSARLEVLAKKRQISLSGSTERPSRHGSWSGSKSEFAFDMLLLESTRRVGVVALDFPAEASQIPRDNLYAMQVKRQPLGLLNWESAQWGLLLGRAETQTSQFHRLGVYILDEDHIEFFADVDLENCVLV
ncbi:MAG: hypothetical protein Q9165_003591 [Trypethelium subeluteriae]